MAPAEPGHQQWGAAASPSQRPGAWRPGLAGAVVVDKPAGMTSHDVVARARRALHERRIGHGGTLDPDATGVLVLGIGPATRLLRFVSELAKTYVGEVVLGTETSTLDSSGAVTAVHDMAGVRLEDVQLAARKLTGHILQIPPMVSAVQVGGQRLHELARQGVTVEREPRPVEVMRLEVLPGPPEAPGVYSMEVDCSSGTYVRSLAADLGRALGGGAHLRNLRRVAVGHLDATSLVPLEALAPDRVGAAGQLVAHLPSVSIDGALSGEVANGKVLGLDRLGAHGEGPWAVHGRSGELLAVYELHGEGKAKPVVVLPAGPGEEHLGPGRAGADPMIGPQPDE